MKFLLLFILISTSISAHADGLLKQYCAEVDGKIVTGLTCPKSKLPLPWKFCVAQDTQGRRLFFDGCTGPSGGYKKLFYPACIQHDHCYHHEPFINGYSKRTCDRNLRASLLKQCELTETKAHCRAWANTMYRAVRGFGKLAYNCAKYEADYEGK